MVGLIKVDLAQRRPQPSGEEYLPERDALGEARNLNITFEVLSAEGMELLDEGEFDLVAFRMGQADTP